MDVVAGVGERWGMWISSMAVAEEFRGTTLRIGVACEVGDVGHRLETRGGGRRRWRRASILKVGLLPAATWLSALGPTPEEPNACCLWANLQTFSEDHRITVRQAVSGVEFTFAEAELKTEMPGRVGSRRRGERCSSRRAVVAGLGWLCVRRCHRRSEQQDPLRSLVEFHLSKYHNSSNDIPEGQG